MKVSICVGPTIEPTHITQLLDAEIEPPVRQGDVVRLLNRGVRVIGIVDGYFERVPAVWHKEILLALYSGVTVFGASSMGALRAAELADFGMIGIGKVFEMYRSGEIEDDDEVAVRHSEADGAFAALSEAMVNIRYVVAQAIQAGAISSGFASAAVAAAKQLHYHERNYQSICAALSVRDECKSEVHGFKAFLRQPRQSLKARDAIAMCNAINQHVKSGRVTIRPTFHLERTMFLEDLVASCEPRT